MIKIPLHELIMNILWLSKWKDAFTHHYIDGASRGKPYDGNDEDSTPGTGIYDDSRDHSSKTSGKGKELHYPYLL